MASRSRSRIASVDVAHAHSEGARAGLHMLQQDALEFGQIVGAVSMHERTTPPVSWFSIGFRPAFTSPSPCRRAPSAYGLGRRPFRDNRKRDRARCSVPFSHWCRAISGRPHARLLIRVIEQLYAKTLALKAGDTATEKIIAILRRSGEHSASSPPLSAARPRRRVLDGRNGAYGS